MEIRVKDISYKEVTIHFYKKLVVKEMLHLVVYISVVNRIFNLQNNL